MPLRAPCIDQLYYRSLFFNVAPLTLLSQIRFGQSVQVKEKNAASLPGVFPAYATGLVVLFAVALSPLSNVPGEVMFSMFSPDGHRQPHYCTIRTNS